MKIELTVNGVERHADVEARKTLLDVLRDDLRLTGVHAGCEHGVCGACTILIDGVPARACLMLGCQADGYVITTIEGLAPAPGELSAVQDAFCETHGLQCGFCTPGMILTAHALLESNAAPDREDVVEAISGNICRCTGYGQIVEAVLLAADRRRGLNADPVSEARSAEAPKSPASSAGAPLAPGPDIVVGTASAADDDRPGGVLRALAASLANGDHR